MITDTFDLRKLDLRESYGFNVLVRDGKSHFAARLGLTPDECTIHIMGEQYGERECSFLRSPYPDCIVCSDINKTFIVSSVELCYLRSSSLGSYPDHSGFFECKFKFKFLVFVPSDYLAEDTFVLSIAIRSKLLNKWIGNTQNQESIITEYEKTNQFPQDEGLLNEFVHFTKSGRVIGVAYPLHAYHSSPEFKAGLTFEPALVLAFEGLVSVRNIQNEYEAIFLLLSFVLGSEFRPESIEFSYGRNLSGTGFVYYPAKKLWPSSPYQQILFPLGRNLRFDQLDLPEFPLDIFSSYYALTRSDIDIWKRYARFRRLENPEERFIGYFRLLERLTHKQKSHVDEARLIELSSRAEKLLIRLFDDKNGVKSFLRGLRRYNMSKYNTEKCIGDYFKSLPNEFREKLALGIADIKPMCDLRNNLSHANDFVLNEGALSKYENFVHVLVVLALFKKLDIDYEISCQIVERLLGFDDVKRRES